MKKLLLLTVSLFALVGAVHAATFQVTSLADSGTGTLRDAVTNANATAGAHTITFQGGLTGTINLDTALPNLTRPLTIVGPGASQLTVRRNGSGTFGAFYITDHSNMTNLTVSGLTFKNINHNNGAIYILYAQGLTISNCVFEGNSSGGVAGVYADSMNTAYITGCVFTNNSGISPGVSLRMDGLTSFTVADCVIANNTSSGYCAGILQTPIITSIPSARFSAARSAAILPPPAAVLQISKVPAMAAITSSLSATLRSVETTLPCIVEPSIMPVRI